MSTVVSIAGNMPGIAQSSIDSTRYYFIEWRAWPHFHKPEPNGYIQLKVPPSILVRHQGTLESCVEFARKNGYETTVKFIW